MPIFFPPASATVPTLRGTNSGTTVGNSITVTLPGGTVAGDLAIIFCDGGFTCSMSGKTAMIIRQSGVARASVFYTWVTAADISTGSYTVSMGGSFDATMIVATFVGNAALRVTPTLAASLDDNSGALISPQSVSSTPGSGTYALYFMYSRGNSTLTINRGSTLSNPTTAANAVAKLNSETFPSGSSLTATSYSWNSVSAGEQFANIYVTLTAEPTPALISNVTTTCTSTCTSAAINTTGAKVLIAQINCFVTNCTNPTLTDSAGNAWTLLSFNACATFLTARIAYVVNPTTSASHTFSVSTTTADWYYNVSAWSGITSFDKEVTNGTCNASGAATSVVSTALTPTVTGATMVAVGIQNAATSTQSIDSSFTALNVNVGAAGVNFPSISSYRIYTTAPASVAPTISSTAAGAMHSHFAIFN